MSSHYYIGSLGVCLQKFSLNQKRSFCKLLAENGIRKDFDLHWDNYCKAKPTAKKTARKRIKK